MAGKKEDRLLNPNPTRHYRRTYSLTEVRIGLVVLVGLASVGAWVAWRGTQPDPELFGDVPGLVRRDEARIDRGVLPSGLAPAGWSERSLSVFDGTNLYVKIDGREGFYKSFGFQLLTFVSLQSDADPTVAVDLELYDLGTADNALGCFTKEAPPGSSPELLDDGLARLDRNALFLTRGKHYLRAVASEEGDRVRPVLDRVRERFLEGLPGEPVAWSYGLFVGGLGLSPGAVSFQPRDAFSFGFADRFHIALLDDNETELFVTARASDEEAAKMVGQLTEGFLQLGERAGEGPGGVTWVKDRYLERLAGARAAGPLVLGVRGAADATDAAGWLQKLAAAVDGLPAAVRDRALAEARAAPPPTGGGGYDDAEPAEPEAPEPGDEGEPGGPPREPGGPAAEGTGDDDTEEAEPGAPPRAAPVEE